MLICYAAGTSRDGTSESSPQTLTVPDRRAAPYSRITFYRAAIFNYGARRSAKTLVLIAGTRARSPREDRVSKKLSRAAGASRRIPIRAKLAATRSNLIFEKLILNHFGVHGDANSNFFGRLEIVLERVNLNKK